MATYRKILFLTLSLLFTMNASSQSLSRVSDGYEVTIEHDFNDIDSDYTVEIESFPGTVKLIPAKGDRVLLTETFFVEAESEEEAREQATRHASKVRKTGRRIYIRNGVAHFGESSLTIELVRGMRAIVSTSVGSIKADGVDGEFQLSSGAGSIIMSNVTGSIDAFSGAGSIDLNEVKGRFVKINLGAGDIDLRDIAADLEIMTGAGDIDISKIRGDVDVTTGGGDIEVADVEGTMYLSTAGGRIKVSESIGDLVVSTSGGDIELDLIVGDVRASTSGGDVRIRAIDGEITVETMAGNIDVFDVERGVNAVSEVGDIGVYVIDSAFLDSETVEVRAENGDIELSLPRGTAASLRVSLGYDGTLNTERLAARLDMDNARSGYRSGRLRRAVFSLNGGGGRIELKSGSGSVEISDIDILP